MKKLLLSSLILLFFAITISIFQISCQKTAIAQTTTYTLPPATTSTLGGVIIGNGLNITSAGILSATTSVPTQLNLILFTKIFNAQSPSRIYEIWLANIDGSNQRKVSVILPGGFTYKGESKLSPDGNTIIFEAGTSTSIFNLYSCKIDGSNVTAIINGDGSPNGQVSINGVY